MKYLFAGLWLVWGGYWLICAFGNKSTVVRVSLWSRLVGLAILFGLMLGRHRAWFDRQLFPRSETILVLGAVLTAAGIAFSIWARANLGRNWSGNPTIKDGHELIQSGPYRFVRHPIYTGLLVAVLGTFLAQATLRGLLLFAYVLIIFAIKIQIEESLMRRQFPEAYPEYARRTKALIPHLI